MTTDKELEDEIKILKSKHKKSAPKLGKAVDKDDKKYIELKAELKGRKDKQKELIEEFEKKYRTIDNKNIPTVDKWNELQDELNKLKEEKQ